MMSSKATKSAISIFLFLLIAVTALLLWSSPAESQEPGFWAGVKNSWVRFGRQMGSFFRDTNRGILKFFRTDVPQAGREIKKGTIEAGKETGRAAKEAGKETAGALERSGLEAKENLQKTGREIKEVFQGSKKTTPQSP